MKKSIEITDDIKHYGQNYWFTISLFIIFCTIIIRKDISLNFSLGATETKQEKSIIPTQENEKELNKKESNKTKEKITQFGEKKTLELPVAKGKIAIFNPFSIFQPASIPEGISVAPIGVPKELMIADEQTYDRYIKRFSKVAVAEMQKYGIPASIVLAQGLLASGAGQSEASRFSNNYFNLPCTEEWKKDKKQYSGGCYRVYKSAWQSFRDHSNYITTGTFKYLKRFSSTNYHEWAKGIQLAGDNDNPDYANELVQLIEKYHLFKHDRR